MNNMNQFINSLHNIVQFNFSFLFIFIFISILALRFFETKMILIFLIVLIIIIYHKEIQQTLAMVQNKNDIKFENNIKNNIHIDEQLIHYFKKLRKYRKYNIHSYERGMVHMKMFLNAIHELEQTDLAHSRHYFENAQAYLHTSMNYFQSITISVTDKNYIQSLKKNGFQQNKKLNKIGKLCKNLYKYCYHLLYNLSRRFNQDFFEQPDIYKKEIDLNAGHIKESNTFTNNWDLY